MRTDPAVAGRVNGLVGCLVAVVEVPAWPNGSESTGLEGGGRSRREMIQYCRSSDGRTISGFPTAVEDEEGACGGRSDGPRLSGLMRIAHRIETKPRLDGF